MMDDTSTTAATIETLAAENERLRGLLARAGVAPDAAGSSGSAVAAERDWLGEKVFARLLIDSIAEGFYAVDRMGRTTLCNDAFLRMIGFDHESEILGRAMHDVIHHSHQDGTPYPADTCPILQAAVEGISRRVTGEIFFRRDGSSFPVSYRAEPIRHDGQVHGAICTVTDMSGQLGAASRLKDSQDRLALAVGAAGIGIWDYAPATGDLQWDARVRELFGLHSDRPVTLDMNLAAIHAQDRPRVDAALADAFDPAGPGRYDVQFRAIGIEDGKERWIAAKGQTDVENGRVARFLGAVRDVTDEKRSELHLRLMVNELNHRVKNSLAMVQGLAAQTFRASDDIVSARDVFTERLVNLARAHDVLTATNWEGSDLHTVVGLTAESHGGEEGRRFEIDGTAVTLSPKAVLSFAMAMHELATNAVKYGALSNDDGRVVVTWRREPDDDGRMSLLFRWEERDGPPVEPPRRRGFGSKLIERGLAAELQGDVRIEFPVTGVVCTIRAPGLAA